MRRDTAVFNVRLLSRHIQTHVPVQSDADAYAGADGADTLAHGQPVGRANCADGGPELQPERVANHESQWRSFDVAKCTAEHKSERVAHRVAQRGAHGGDVAHGRALAFADVEPDRHAEVVHGRA